MNKNTSRRGPYYRNYSVTLDMSGNDKNKKSFRDSLIRSIAHVCAEIESGNMKAGDFIGVRRVKCS